MSTSQNVLNSPTPGEEITEISGDISPRQIAEIFQRGLEKTATAQKGYLDAMAQNGGEMVEYWTKTLNYFPVFASMFELAGQTAIRFIEAQKDIVDLFAEQSKEYAGMWEEQGEIVDRAMSQATERMDKVREVSQQHLKEKTKEMGEMQHDIQASGEQVA